MIMQFFAEYFVRNKNQHLNAVWLSHARDYDILFWSYKSSSFQCGFSCSIADICEKCMYFTKQIKPIILIGTHHLNVHCNSILSRFLQCIQIISLYSSGVHRVFRPMKFVKLFPYFFPLCYAYILCINLSYLYFCTRSEREYLIR